MRPDITDEVGSAAQPASPVEGNSSPPTDEERLAHYARTRTEVLLPALDEAEAWLRASWRDEAEELVRRLTRILRQMDLVLKSCATLAQDNPQHVCVTTLYWLLSREIEEAS